MLFVTKEVIYIPKYIVIKVFFLKILLINFRKRERENGREGQNERKRETQAVFMLSLEPGAGLNLITLTSDLS